MSHCSSCGVPIRPIVAVDVDGTLSEYHMSIANHVWAYCGMPRRMGQWDGFGNYEDWLGVTQAQYREAKLAYRQGGFKRWSPVMPGVNELLAAMVQWKQEQDLEVWITTTRPWMRLDSTDPDTRFWLDRNFPIYDHILYHDSKYHQLRQIVDPDRVVAILDDLPEQMDMAVQSFGESIPFMVARPHNRARTADYSHTGSLLDAVRHIRQNLYDWRRSHPRNG